MVIIDLSRRPDIEGNPAQLTVLNERTQRVLPVIIPGYAGQVDAKHVESILRHCERIGEIG
jgi:hypothetical protein